MAKKTEVPETINLRAYIDCGDAAELVYLIVKAFVSERNDEDERVKKGQGNRAQAKYLQRVVEILSDTQTKLESL